MNIHAPFTPAQVEHLNNWQIDGRVVPLTCGKCRTDLVATVDGWICPTCGYRQDWAPAEMAEPYPLSGLQRKRG